MPSTTSMQEVFAEYRDECDRSGRSHKHLAAIDRLSRDLGHLYPKEITGKLLSRHFRQEKKVSDSTFRKDGGTVKAAIKFAHENNLISGGDVNIIRLPTESEPRPHFWTAEEVKKAQKAAIADSKGKDRLTRPTIFLFLGLACGGRASAIRELTWDRCHPVLPGAVDLRDPGLRPNKKRRARVPIPNRLTLQVLEKAHAQRVSRHVLGLDRRLFIGEWNTFRKNRLDFMPYSKTSAHVMRHTFATSLLNKGVNIWTVAKLLGDTVPTVEKTYGHIDQSALRAELERTEND